jgi:hypothetical protein
MKEETLLGEGTRGDKVRLLGHTVSEHFFAHRQLEGGAWTLTHIPSGWCIDGLFLDHRFPISLDECAAVAAALEPLYDWSAIKPRGKSVAGLRALRRQRLRFRGVIQDTLQERAA